MSRGAPWTDFAVAPAAIAAGWTPAHSAALGDAFATIDPGFAFAAVTVFVSQVIRPPRLWIDVCGTLDGVPWMATLEYPVERCAEHSAAAFAQMARNCLALYIAEARDARDARC